MEGIVNGFGRMETWVGEACLVMQERGEEAVRTSEGICIVKRVRFD